MAISIIDTKDVLTDNYRISAGRFVADMAVVSSLAISSKDVDGDGEGGFIPDCYYLGIPSTGHKIRWTVEGGGATFMYKACNYACEELNPLLSYPTISTNQYQFSAGRLLNSSPERWVKESWVNNNTKIVGGKESTGDPDVMGVHPCLIIPTPGEIANVGNESAPIWVNTVSSKSFWRYTLYGGVESVRLTMTIPPTAVVTVAVSSSSGVVSAKKTFEYYELSSNILNQDNTPNSWSMSASGFMYPNVRLPDNWKVGWIIPESTESVSAYACDEDFDNETFYEFGSAATRKDDVSIERMKFCFSEPGIKTITFCVLKNPALPLDETNSFATYTISSMFFNNPYALRVKYVDADYTGTPSVVRLSAVSHFSNGRREIHLDDGYPQISWKWDEEDKLVLKSEKTDQLISNGVLLNPAENDFISISANKTGIYKITAHTGFADEVYTWNNFVPKQIKLKHEINNCLEIRRAVLSATTQLGNEIVLFQGEDRAGIPHKIKWTWTGDNVTLYSKGGMILKDSVLPASQANPATAYFNDRETLVQTLCTTMFTVSTPSISTINPPPSAKTAVEYDLYPKGFDIDFDINFETASEINNEFYRIVNDTSYKVILKGKIKGDEKTGWLTDEEISEIDDSDNKIYYYWNGDETTKTTGVNATAINFTLSEGTPCISSITYKVSCVKASPAFGYGKTKSKTVVFKLYHANDIPELSAIVYPEYVWGLPNSIPPVSSLYVDSVTSLGYLPTPTAYGEGRTNIFLTSASSIDNKYNGFVWHSDFSEPVNDSVYEIAVKSFPGQNNGGYITVGGFIQASGLMNYRLSTYKSDDDGSIQTFKNWKTIDTPFLNVQYEQPTSIGIKRRFDIKNNKDVDVYFSLDFLYPNYSPVRINRQNTEILWRAETNTGETYTEKTIGKEDFKITFPAETSLITTVFVNASARVAEHIPNQSGFIFNYPDRMSTYEIPTFYPETCAINVEVVNFSLSGSNEWDILDSGTDVITAFSPTTVTGISSVGIPITDCKWTVDGVDIVNQNYNQTFPDKGEHPSNYTPTIIPLEFTITGGGKQLTRKKTLIVDPPIKNLDWKIVPDNLQIAVGEKSFLYNFTYSPIKLSKVSYSFDGDNFSDPLDVNDLFVYSFNEVGNKTLTVSALDVKGHSYTIEINNFVTVVSEWEKFSEHYFIGDETKLLHSNEKVLIKPNEWVSDSNVINNSFNLLYENLLYLEDVSRFYANPPCAYSGWFGVYDKKIKWNFGPFDENYNFIEDEYKKLENLISYRVFNEKYILLAYKDKVEVRKNEYFGELLETKSERSINDSFEEIKNAVTDKNGKIIILDSHKFGTITVYEYDPILRHPFKFIVRWGGLGGQDSKTKFRNANDLTIDSDDNLYVSDTGNRCIKKFTSTGGWLATITSTAFSPLPPTNDVGTVDNGSVMSAGAGSDGRLYALTKDKIVVFKDGLEEKVFEWRKALPEKELTPIKIVASDDNGMCYVICKDIVLKFTKDGYYVGSFGEVSHEYDTDISNVEYVNAFHTPSKAFYLISKNFVLKYIDYINYLSIKPRLRNLWWQKDALNIKREEFVEYWIYNKVFSRFWDNMDYFRATLRSRIVLSSDENGKMIFKVYNRSNEFRPPFKYKKEDIMIGLNELVTPDVVNRCISRLYYCMEELLFMIISQNVKYRWVDTIKIGSNPLLWEQTKQTGEHPIRWGNAKG